MAVHEKTKYTVEEYQRLMEQPEYADRIFELIDGELVEKLPSFIPSEIAGNIVVALKLFIRENQLGHISLPDGGYTMSNGDVLVPDVAYISKERLPEKPKREVLVPPDLAVEIKSPTDRKRALRNKVERYLQSGTPLVWLVFPEENVVEVYSANEDSDVQTLTIDDVLDGGSILPGFKLKVSDVFAEY